LSQPAPDIDSLVRARFRVKDSFVLPEGELEYKVEYEEGASKKQFEELCSELSRAGYTPRLFGSKEDASLIVRKTEPVKTGRSMLPPLFAGLTAASIVAFALIWVFFYHLLAPEISPYFVVFSYCACLGALLLAHELGHRYIARKAKSKPPVPLAIPGIPGFTAFLPSLGIISLRRGHSANRDSLIDLALGGPIAAFLLSLVIYIAGEFLWVQSSVTIQSAQSAGSFIGVQTLNPSLIQVAIDSVATPLTRALPSGFVRLSPLLDAGTVGLFLTFLNLLPITHFDGGNVLSSAFGGRGLRVTSVLCALALVLIDTPNYLFLGLFVLLIAGRQEDVQCLDEISPTSNSRKLFFIVALVVALLCLPIPQRIATIAL
jgi:membrane-associated protease RseP (regulator of RpoE activity)